MIRADRWLLENVFEPAACEIESWTGVSPYRLARFCVLVAITADAAIALNLRTSKGYAMLGFSLFAAGCLVAMTFMAQHLSGRSGTSNWFKHDRLFGWCRMGQFTLGGMSALLAVLTLRPSLATLSSVATALAYGFMSGDRLPPKERYVFSWGKAAPSNA